MGFNSAFKGLNSQVDNYVIFHKLASYTDTYPNCVRKIFGTENELRKIIRGMEVSDFRGSPVVRIYLN
jgi:hypothetical protein